MSTRKANVATALTEARALIAALESFDGSDDEHLGLLRRADRVRVALEEPVDLTTRWAENLNSAAALNLASRIGALAALPADGMAAADLAAQCRVDVSVVVRTMRMLVANGIGRETAAGLYARNSLSDALQPMAWGGHACMFVDFVKTLALMPDYLAAHEPEDLRNPRKSPFAFAAGHEGKTYFQVIDLDVEQRDVWNRVFQNMDKNYPILGLFPFRRLEGPVRAQPDRAFIVDVGGGRGHSLRTIRDDCGSSFGGRLVLQDLPAVVESLRPDEIPGIEPMAYDAFTPQPVKSEYAHVYFMRRFLHDFYRPEAAQILRNTALAMGPDSRLIVSDLLLPERVEVGGPLLPYWTDLDLMTLGGQERSLSDFETLFDDAGLELVEVYRAERRYNAMLETRLKTAT